MVSERAFFYGNKKTDFQYKTAYPEDSFPALKKTAFKPGDLTEKNK